MSMTQWQASASELSSIAHNALCCMLCQDTVDVCHLRMFIHAHMLWVGATFTCSCVLASSPHLPDTACFGYMLHTHGHTCMHAMGLCCMWVCVAHASVAVGTCSSLHYVVHCVCYVCCVCIML